MPSKVECDLRDALQWALDHTDWLQIRYHARTAYCRHCCHQEVPLRLVETLTHADDCPYLKAKQLLEKCREGK